MKNDVEQSSRALRSVTRTALSRLRALTPPAAGRTFHTHMVDVFETYIDIWTDGIAVLQQPDGNALMEELEQVLRRANAADAQAAALAAERNALAQLAMEID